MAWEPPPSCPPTIAGKGGPGETVAHVADAVSEEGSPSPSKASPDEG